MMDEDGKEGERKDDIPATQNASYLRFFWEQQIQIQKEKEEQQKAAAAAMSAKSHDLTAEGKFTRFQRSTKQKTDLKAENASLIEQTKLLQAKIQEQNHIIFQQQKEIEELKKQLASQSKNEKQDE
eukprot:CAMPEP_0201539128 /NCGR_PEP_ID=MMETSP0161_2-20130828/69532_1 /ASSEMBLY_ACC=CAM_ASM_000251 /TAXON_ID=180227 /ORGANISM="Neoparamoeba aestuarina, Strain SoJaBio B1-5/56/2" /LENGTH=125 /DNA_ID=CAMNT_0047946331 /DNA_START=131 /DNA_END=508 /DNA_ORIENTATION=-